MPPTKDLPDTASTSDPTDVLVARALQLFDATADVHRLAPEQRAGLTLAAACYAAARQADAARPDLAGRDAVLAAPRAGLSPEQLCVIASAVAFQRARLRRRREPAFVWLSSAAQTQALRLGALLMLADALREAPAAAIQISQVAGQTTIHVAEVPAGLAADPTPIERWQRYIGPLQIAELATRPLEQAAEAAVAWELPAAWGPVSVPLHLHAAEPMSEGARRTLRHQFERLLSREQAVRDGEDIEDVHQMRVATRRLRASLQIVEPFFDAELGRRFRRGLRRVAAALGAVRDRDVFLDHLSRHQEGMPERARDALKPLRAAVVQDRAEARLAMLECLDTPRYMRLKRSFAEFLTTPGVGVAPLPEAGAPLRVRDAAGSLLWRRYEELRSFDAALLDGPEELQHQARIAGKRLRYAVECFAEAIGEPTAWLLEPLAALLETLGELQDEATARLYIAELGLKHDPGAQDYLDKRHLERVALLRALPGRWEQVIGSIYRTRLLAVLDAL